MKLRHPPRPDPGDGHSPAIDINGMPVPDPTKNVLDLVRAESIRQDDLREAERRLRESATDHVREMVAVNKQHSAELRAAEAKRIDAIRETDTTALVRAQQVSAEQASALAKQVTESAEVLRKQVTDAGSFSAAALSAALAPLQKDIEALRSFRSEQTGARTQVAEKRVDERADSANLGVWVGIAVTALIGTLAILIGVANLIYAVTK